MATISLLVDAIWRGQVTSLVIVNRDKAMGNACALFCDPLDFCRIEGGVWTLHFPETGEVAISPRED
jgi:hypothetical protein